MIGFANAKINIGLFITEKRSDGYHNLETIFYPIAINDTIEFIVSNSSSTIFNAYGISIPGVDSENLIVKAYHLLRKDFDLPQLEFSLIKNIPIGGGLGGGSSDAATVIMMINDYFNLNLNQSKMIEYASQLGSDCAFFIINQPCFASGRGDLLTPINLSLKNLKLVLIHPGIHVSTKEAFSNIKPKEPTYDLRNLESANIQNWKNLIKNDFEESVFISYPELEKIKAELYRSGALFAAMSGSGSSVYGIYEEIPTDQKWPDHYYVKHLVL